MTARAKNGEHRAHSHRHGRRTVLETCAMVVGVYGGDGEQQPETDDDQRRIAIQIAGDRARTPACQSARPAPITSTK